MTALLTGRTALVHEIRRLADAVVDGRMSDEVAAEAAATVSSIVDVLPVQRLATPWYWQLPPTTRDGSSGWLRDNPAAPPVHLVWDVDVLTGSVRLGLPFIGPPGRVHGGYVAAVLDHVLGHYLVGIGRSGFTLELTIRYPEGTPIDSDLEIAVGHSAIDGRKTWAWAEIRDQGVTTARAEGLFLTFVDSAGPGAPDRRLA